MILAMWKWENPQTRITGDLTAHSITVCFKIKLWIINYSKIFKTLKTFHNVTSDKSDFLCISTFSKISDMFVLQYDQLKVGLITPYHKISKSWVMAAFIFLKHTDNKNLHILKWSYFHNYSTNICLIVRTRAGIPVESHLHCPIRSLGPVS